MSGLNAAFNTLVSGSKGYSEMFSAYAYDVTNAGAVAAKERSGFLTTINSLSTPTSFSPAGISFTPTINIESVGGVKPSDVVTNMMLNTQAMFVVSGSRDNSVSQSYGFTKVGTFYPNDKGDIMNHAGQYLQVLPVANNISPNTPPSTLTQLSTLNVGNLIGLPAATSKMSLHTILPATSVNPSMATLQNPQSMRSQEKLIYDDKGNPYTLTITYTRLDPVAADLPNGIPGDPPNTERWGLTVGCKTLANPPVAIANADIAQPWVNGVSILFQGGKPFLINPDAQNNQQPVPDLTIAPQGIAVSPMTISMNLGSVGKADGLTTVGPTFNMQDINADGTPMGTYSGLSFDKDGNCVIRYTNQTNAIVGRVVIATFPSLNKLSEQSAGVFFATQESGAYSLRFPNNEIISSALEDSSVNAADTYVQMAQDGKRFSACISGIGKTVQMLDDLEEMLKRS